MTLINNCRLDKSRTEKKWLHFQPLTSSFFGPIRWICNVDKIKPRVIFNVLSSGLFKFFDVVCYTDINTKFVIPEANSSYLVPNEWLGRQWSSFVCVFFQNLNYVNL